MSSFRRIKELLILFIFALLGNHQVVAQDAASRFALIIGNSAYKGSLEPLKNPVNDAQDVASAFKRLGYTVEVITDADRNAMELAVVRLAESLSSSAASTGVFYYAGHGVQSQGINYLIPVDANIPAEAFLRDRAVSAQVVLDLMQGAGNRLNLVVLDACRNNPFTWSRSANSRGLSVVASQPPGSVVVYATSAGSVAQDGEGRNSPFTQEFLKHLETPGIDMNTLLDRTGEGVRMASGFKQNPAVYKQFFGMAYIGIPPQDSVMIPQKAEPSVSSPQPVTASSSMPVIDVEKIYGNLKVSTVTGGVLYLDNVKMVELTSNSRATLNNVEIGDRKVEIRYPSGDNELNTTTVVENQTASVSFTWKPVQQKPSQSVTPLQPAQASLSTLPKDFVFVEGGSFMMGSPLEDPDRSRDEVEHEVTLSSFAISKYLVTFEDYDEFCSTTGHQYIYSARGGREKRPVISVSWYDAIEYCNWRSLQDGRTPVYSIGDIDFSSGRAVNWDRKSNGYRLPTEAEWEYAARGGKNGGRYIISGRYAGITDVNQAGWYYSNSDLMTQPVGQKMPNGLGLFDMAGNVFEWCWDIYGEYTEFPDIDPLGSASGQNRVIRGGSWKTFAMNLRSTYRGSKFPKITTTDLGFRLVCNLEIEE